MGWYESIHGGVFGDPVADYLDELADGRLWRTPSDIPPAILAHIESIYASEFGRRPTDADLQAVVGYVQNRA